MARGTNGPRKATLASRRGTARREQSAQYAKTRSELLAAAATVFRRKGYRGATFSEIARAARMDRGSLYYYSSGKRELFYSLVRDAVLQNVVVAETIAASAVPPTEKLRDIVRGLMQSYASHFPYLYIYIQEDMTQIAPRPDKFGREMIQLNRRYDRAVTDIIVEGQKDGSFREAPPQVVRLAILGMVSWTHRWYRPDGSLSAEELANVFAAIALHGVERSRRSST